MTERERAINQDLHVLDEAHRLGRITRAEYRARRRHVLESLYDSSGVVTARNTLVPPVVTFASRGRTAHALQADETSGASGHALTALLSMRPKVAWKPLLAFLAGLVLLILLVCWLLLRD